MFLQKTVEQILLDNSTPEPNTGCRLWTRAQSDGYGMMRVGKSLKHTARIAYAIWVGVIPADKIVYHKCGVTLCIEPTHLGVRSRRWHILQSKNNNQGNTCVHGHDREVYGYKNPTTGFISCKECRRLAKYRYKRNRK